MGDLETKNFENDSFSIEVTEEAGCTLSLRITVKPSETKKTHKKAVKAVNKQISIPGFRKGHAPDQTVISRYASYVEQEWKEILLNTAYRAALDLVQIYPLNKESIKPAKIESYTLEEGAKILLSYEHYPNVPTIDFSEITIPEIEEKVPSEKSVEEAAKEVCRSFAEYETVSKKNVELNDYVELSIHSLEEDPPKPIVENQLFHLKEEMVGWLKKALIDMQVGESVETTTEEKPTKVRVTLHAIKKIIIPELTDELAKKAGITSKDDLLEKIRANLEKEAKQEQHKKRIAALEEALLERYDFDLPASLVDSEKKERLQKKEKGSEEEVVTEVKRMLHLYFINKQIAEQGNITLSQKELSDEISLYSAVAVNKQGEISRDTISRIASVLIESKTQAYALSQVKTQAV